MDRNKSINTIIGQEQLGKGTIKTASKRIKCCGGGIKQNKGDIGRDDMTSKLNWVGGIGTPIK